MTSSDLSQYFDAYYYAHCCGRPYARTDAWFDFFDSIAQRIVADIRPSTVLDVGCAWGFLVEKLRQRGVEAYGIDISEYAIQNVHPDMQPYCWVGSAVDPFPRHYDLIVSIEVMEHMPREQAEKAIENICAHGKDVLFSSTPFDYKEATHVNVHPPEYWGEQFARHSFFRDIDFDASVITPWATRYQQKDVSPSRLVRDFERKFFLLWKENVDLRLLVGEMRNELASLHRQIEALSTSQPDQPRDETPESPAGPSQVHDEPPENPAGPSQAQPGVADRFRALFARSGQRKE